MAKADVTARLVGEGEGGAVQRDERDIQFGSQKSDDDGWMIDSIDVTPKR
jgi:hypothetical protein